MEREGGREREGEREREREGGREGGREERERLSILQICIIIIVMIFFSIAGRYFVAVRGRLSPDKLLLNN